MHRLSLFAAAFAGIAMPALAQQNEVYIEQRGVGNQLTIDQSEAENSRVGGLTIGTVAGVPVNALSGRPALRNVLDIEVPVLQAGNGNVASVDVAGGGASQNEVNQLGLVQLGGGNTATIGALGEGLIGTITQAGFLNEATLDLSDDGSRGSIFQAGNLNDASLSVSENGQGVISQVGSFNGATLDVVGTSVTLNQVGSGLNFNNQAVSVISNAASVTITQTGFGTGN